MPKMLARKRFAIAAVSLCGLALALGASRLWAQQEKVGSTSADEAAKMFIAYLTLPDLRSSPEDIVVTVVAGADVHLISAKSFEQLGEAVVHEVVRDLVQKVLLARWQTQTTTAKEENSAVVQVTPGNDLKPIVCIREGEYWYVDLVETAKHWFQPNDKVMQRIQYELTGVDPGGRRNNEICQSNLKQIALGMKLYMQDYDEIYAPANKWCDVIEPYVKRDKVYHCPAASKNQYGYAMNWKLSRRNESEVNYVADTVIFYESNVLRRNQNGDGRDLAFRHTMDGVLGANYAYMDGHVAWARQGAAQNFRLAPSGPPVVRDSRDMPTVVFPPATITPATTVVNEPPH